ncbi:TerC family protein [Segetibacter aerophilus]|uniref:Membrane protein n=1 Tax=Segetibacter aerophilus TaxID=670293 RepID=A0A512B771_9BACT|nr:TerC family protein [Segetibacter aerophilus]GEO07811.1 membrane protein [Segetibacter aerophilus]
MEQIIALVTLILLEVVLGLDNIIFISIIAAKLPAHQQKKARRLGIMLAMVLRLALLTIISIILKLQGELFSIFGNSISSKDVILILGGLFLLYKSSSEIYHKIEGEEGDASTSLKATSFKSTIIQILILDLVFSVDSIITAVGMVNELWIMYAAVIITVGIMLFASEPISAFINKHPAFKMLALSFLLLIGVSLIGEGLNFNIPKGYIYFAIAFSLAVDVLQMKMHKPKQSKVQLHEHYLQGEEKVEKDIL